MDPSALLVVEHGADWTAWMEATGRLGPSIIALIQEREEPAYDFAARVKARVNRLKLQGSGIRQLTLLGAADGEVPTLQARLSIVRKVREASPDVGIELRLDPRSPRARLASRARMAREVA